MIKFLKSMFSKGEKKMTNVSNLKNLKQNADNTQKAFEDELKRINDLLPNGVTIEWEGGDGQTEILVDINNKSDLLVGDTIRCTVAHYNCLTEGRNYQVIRFDASGDAQIIDDDGDEFDTLGGTNGNFKKVCNRPQQKQSNQWKTLHRDNRHELKIGDEIRFKQGGGGEGITAGLIYRIFEKPDADGRFRDNDNDRRDTDFWTYPEGSSHNMIEFRSV